MFFEPDLYVIVVGCSAFSRAIETNLPGSIRQVVARFESNRRFATNPAVIYSKLTDPDNATLG